MRAPKAIELGAAALAVLLACRPEPKATEPAARPAAPATDDGSLRPMTSRDEAPASAATAPAADPHAGHSHAGDPPVADPHASGTLPPGHPPVEGGAAPAAQGGSIHGTIDVSPALKGRVKGGAIYVIARNAKSRQIVAVRRLDESTLPQKFELSEAWAMTPGTPFTGPLNVTARWAQTGDAMPTPGDIEGTLTDVAVSATNLKVVLSDVRK